MSRAKIKLSTFGFRLPARLEGINRCIMTPHLLPQSDQINQQTRTALTIVEKQFELSTEKLNDILNKFLAEFERGLEEDVNSTVKKDEKSFM